MKNVFIKIVFIIILIIMLISLSGCTLKIETTDNSISASVDEDTTEQVDGVIDWIKNRIRRIFVNDNTESTQSETIEKDIAPIIGDDSTVL